MTKRITSTLQKKKAKQEEMSDNSPYLPIYNIMIDDVDISVDEIVNLAYFRHRLHEEISNASIEDDTKIDDRISKALTRYAIPFNYITKNRSHQPEIAFESIFKGQKAKTIDEYSFFALMLISLRSLESQMEFINNEVRIFSYRLRKQDQITIADIEKTNLLNLADPPLDLKKYQDTNNAEKFYIPFERIFQFVNPERVLLENGKVEVEKKDLHLLLSSLYREQLGMKMAQYRRSRVHESEIFEVASTLFTEKLGSMNTSNMKRTETDKVSLKDIDLVANRSFPPCMYNMYKTLRNRHKLYHDGRLQFGLFIKGIGLTMNESLQFWKEELSKSVGLDKFEKQYAYNIRYNYGKEGSARNFLPYSCMHLIKKSTKPSGDQVHGCPLYQNPEESSMSLLRLMFPKKSNSELRQIAVKGIDHPQVACAQLFNMIHPNNQYDSSNVSHPNDYFFASEEAFIKEIENL